MEAIKERKNKKQREKGEREMGGVSGSCKLKREAKGREGREVKESNVNEEEEEEEEEEMGEHCNGRKVDQSLKTRNTVHYNYT